MLPIRSISYLLPMCCNFWEKCKNSPKTDLGCSTPLRQYCHEETCAVYWRQYVVTLSYLLKTAWSCFQMNINIETYVFPLKTTLSYSDRFWCDQTKWVETQKYWFWYKAKQMERDSFFFSCFTKPSNASINRIKLQLIKGVYLFQ